MKRIMKKIFFIAVMILFFNVEVHAEDLISSNKNSIVQVITGYRTDDGKFLVLKSGSGIVIEQSTVVTDYNLLHLSDKLLTKRKKYIKKNFEYEIDLSNNQNIIVAVIDKGDSLIDSTVINESNEYGFSILQLSKPIERPSAVLGDSSSVSMASNVIMMGYPSVDDVKKDENTFLSVNSINLLSGVVSELSDNQIRVGTKISKGNSGGALIDSTTGNIIGMLIYDSENNERECSIALPINVIKGFLGTIPYIDAQANTQIEEEKVAEIVEIPVDKEQLNNLVINAKQLDINLYTEESYTNLVNTISEAEDLLKNEEVTQEEIDNMLLKLQTSMNNLEEVPVFNWSLIIIIILVVVLLIVMIVLIIILVKNNKEKKQANLQNIPQSTNYQNQFVNNVSTELYNNMNNTTAPNQKGSNATTVLNQNNQQGTTVLNAGATQITAYIIRKKNNESNIINGPEFIIGKDMSMVDYCISGNESISRRHVKIIKRGINYLLIDLKSTNNTYINSEQLVPEKEYILSSGDTIKLADEEFLFEIR